LEADVESMRSRLDHITPASLNDLIPSPDKNYSPAMMVSQLRKASGVIDVALTSQIPAAAGSLAPLRVRTSEIIRRNKKNAQISSAAASAAVRLDGYEIFSKDLEAGRVLDGEAGTGHGRNYTVDQTWTVPPTVRTLMRWGIDCKTDRLSGIGFSTDPREFLIYQVQLFTCSQGIDGARWIQDTFRDSTIEYNGGQLSLADVRFLNCKFRFGNDLNSRTALAAIEASKGAPVSIFIQNEPKPGAE
jgi:hypothetical protein